MVMIGNGKKIKKSVGWVFKSCASWSLWHINSHRNVSVIEKGGDNEKKNSQGMRSFRAVPDRRRKTTDNTFCAGGHVNMLLEKMERAN